MKMSYRIYNISEKIPIEESWSLEEIWKLKSTKYRDKKYIPQYKTEKYRNYPTRCKGCRENLDLRTKDQCMCCCKCGIFACVPRIFPKWIRIKAGGKNVISAYNRGEIYWV
jgi:hypothetical protein